MRHRIIFLLLFHQGYLNNESDDPKIVDGDKWFRTGDIGYFDRDGFLHLIDRKKEMLKYCNYHVSPTELELCIQEHFPVDGVCVIGIDDEKCGQLPAAVIVRKGSVEEITEEAVIKLIAGKKKQSLPPLMEHGLRCRSTTVNKRNLFNFPQIISPIRRGYAVEYSSSMPYQ